MADRKELDLASVSKDIVNQLTAIIRTAQIHDPSNVAVISAAEKFVAMINYFTSRGEPVKLELLGEYFYVNDARVKFSMEYLMNFDFLVHEFKRRSLGSVGFSGKLSINDMKAFLKAFISAAYSPEPFKDLFEGTSSLSSLSIGRLRKIKEETRSEDIRKAVKSTYFNAVSFSKGVMKKLQAGEKVHVKVAKRVVQSMVDMLLTDEDLMMGMTAIKDYDDYTYHHSVNVSILSISLGQKLAFSKNALLELGLVALFHDVGKTEVPPEVLNKPTSFTDEEWRIMRKHPVWGVRALLKMKGFDLISVRAAIVTFEHHIHIDGTGYPERSYPQELDLYSRIVALADQYDGMTSSRVYSRFPMSAEKALSIMMEKLGRHLDPLLFKFFVNMVGTYPAGSAVLLNTRQLGVVYSNNVAFPERPKVMVITDSKGNRVQPHVVDLTEKTGDGKYKRSVVKTMDPHKFKLNLVEYLL